MIYYKNESRKATNCIIGQPEALRSMAVRLCSGGIMNYQHIEYVKQIISGDYKYNIWKDKDTNIEYAVDTQLIIKPPIEVFIAIDKDELKGKNNHAPNK